MSLTLSILIEPQWNVDISAGAISITNETILIEPQWNVDPFVDEYTRMAGCILIEPQWNVDFTNLSIFFCISTF